MGIPLHSFLTRNRVRRAEKKGEKQEDHFLTRDTIQVEPLFVASGDRSADCINRTRKKLPCHCPVESLWYTKKKCMILVWEIDELESLGLPPKDADIVIFSVKHYLLVRWIVANPEAFRENKVPTADSFAKLNLIRSMSLSETFAICLDADSHSRDSWERSVDDPKMRAYLLDYIYKIARQHRSLFENAYAPFQLRYKPPFIPGRGRLL